MRKKNHSRPICNAMQMETKVAGGKVLIVIDECTYRLAFAALTCAGHRHSHIEKMLKPLHFVLKLQFTVNSAVSPQATSLSSPCPFYGTNSCASMSSFPRKQYAEHLQTEKTRSQHLLTHSEYQSTESLVAFN